jgi:diacylglycerol kinase family enzyme
VTERYTRLRCDTSAPCAAAARWPVYAARVSRPRPHDVALLCNPRAGGRWRVLADVLDSDEAKHAHRIVTDDIDDVRAAIAGLGQRVKLLCIYGGDGTIYHVINELLRDPGATPPRLALLGGGTMNVTAGWCGMRRSPGENFRQVMRAYTADRLLLREVPLLAVEQKGRVSYGFTFGAGPLVRVLVRYEAGKKTRGNAVVLGVKSALGAVSRFPRDVQPMLRELEGRVTSDGSALPWDRFAAVFANVTGVINPFVEPFVAERTRDSFHFLAYAVSSREFAMMAPLLARGRLPIDPRSLLHPVSTWRQALLSLVGRGGLPLDPRYVNQPARHVVLETPESHYTIDGEVFPSLDGRLDLRLGPQLHLATLGARRLAPVRRLPK